MDQARQLTVTNCGQLSSRETCSSGSARTASKAEGSRSSRSKRLRRDPGPEDLTQGDAVRPREDRGQRGRGGQCERESSGGRIQRAV
eukprot:4438535-Pyramimonas_sp.AAC.1